MRKALSIVVTVALTIAALALLWTRVGSTNSLATRQNLIKQGVPPALHHPHPTRFRKLDQYWSDSSVVMDGLYHLYNPDILQVRSPPSAVYRMYLFGWGSDICNSALPGCDAIFHLHSDQLDNWPAATHPTPRLQPTLFAGDDYWNQWHIGDPSIIAVSGTYFASFSTSGFDQDGINPHPDPAINPSYTKDTDDYYYSIGGAVSADGLAWQSQTTPLLTSSAELGANDFAVNGTYQRPSLLYENGRFRLWFDYFHANPTYRHSMGYAEAIGPPTAETFRPQNWVVRQAGDYPAIPNWPNPEIVKLPFGYLAFADPKGHGEIKWVERKTSMAFSDDGLNWRILGFIDHDQDCEANHIPEAYVEDEVVYLFTACMNNLRYQRLKLRKLSFDRLAQLLRDTRP